MKVFMYLSACVNWLRHQRYGRCYNMMFDEHIQEAVLFCGIYVFVNKQTAHLITRFRLRPERVNKHVCELGKTPIIERGFLRVQKTNKKYFTYKTRFRSPETLGIRTSRATVAAAAAAARSHTTTTGAAVAAAAAPLPVRRKTQRLHCYDDVALCRCDARDERFV